jgi:polyhydroxyalkanoate synthase
MTTGKPRRSRKPRAKPGSGHADIDVPANDGFAPEAAPASAAEAAEQASLGRQDASAAAEQILGANPLIGIDKGEILDAARRALRLIALRPQMLLEENMTFGREVIDVLLGRSTIEPPDPKDRRFSHEIWRKSGYYKRLMQGFFAWRNMLNRVLDRADATEADRERARFALSLLTEALAPSKPAAGACCSVRATCWMTC